MKRTLSALALAFMLCFTANASVNIIPAPGKIVEGKGEFVLKGNAVIGYNDASISEAATYLKEILAPATGFDLRTRQGSGTINLELSFPADPQDESYTLKVTRKKVAELIGEERIERYIRQSRDEFLSDPLVENDYMVPGGILTIRFE